MPCQCDYMMKGSNDGEDAKVIDELGQHLCFLCGELKEDNLLNQYASKAILKWWKEHQQEDAKRVSRKIREAYKKRTAEQVANSLIKEAKKVHAVSRFHVKWFHSLAKKIYADMLAKEKLKTQKIALAKNAKKKLTLAERKALGIK